MKVNIKRAVCLLGTFALLFSCACAPQPAQPAKDPAPDTARWASPIDKPLPDTAKEPPKLLYDGSPMVSSGVPDGAYVYPDGEGPVAITLKEGTLRPDRAVFILRNTGNTTPVFAPYAPELQVLIDGEWETPVSYSGGGGVDLALHLEPGTELELPTDWHVRYGELSPGTYRFIKDFNYLTKGDFYSSCTFVIEAEDRSDEKFQGYPWPIGLEDEGDTPDDIPVSLTVVPETLTPGSADFVLNNQAHEEVSYAIIYSLQIQIEDKWYRIEWRKVGDKISEPPLGWEVTKPVPPGSSATITFDWEHACGKLPAGTYRVVRRAHCGQHSLFSWEGSFDLYSEPFTIE